MNYCNIKYCDIANGEGVRTTLFVSGCTNHCEECFQPETWDFEYGAPFTVTQENDILKSLEPYYVNGLTLLGGEPFEPANQRGLLPFLKRLKREFPEKTVWCFTGFTLDKELLQDGSYPRCEVTDEMLSCIDVLVDGRYVKALHDISLRFRGSSNQRIIDLNKTRSAGEIVLWDDGRGR
ncbi:MAG: anaerobic ribonucleoside-triphosphate reductase activating protein [Clostridia bacterium]|nr:anaerobic ribonucleoside-triphosphate reductase activating protein [Clostridia bacterium]